MNITLWANKLQSDPSKHTRSYTISFTNVKAAVGIYVLADTIVPGTGGVTSRLRQDCIVSLFGLKISQCSKDQMDPPLSANLT